jgi:3',5'-cyclic AMP phosphodiesterase CpdA
MHLSDLHTSGGYFVPDWAEAVVEASEAIRPDLTVIAGDLTTEGHVDEYDRALRLIREVRTGALVVVPGNHDARNEGYVLFEEMFGTRYPHFENELVSVLGIDSSQPDVDDGHIGRSNYAQIAERLAPSPRLRILAMHHHLIPIPGTGRERHIPTDSGDVLRLCVEQRIDLILSGHKHLPWVWRLQNTHLVTGGTATSRRLKGRSYPSFNVITLAGGMLTLEEYNVATGGVRGVLSLLRTSRPEDGALECVWTRPDPISALRLVQPALS